MTVVAALPVTSFSFTNWTWHIGCFVVFALTILSVNFFSAYKVVIRFLYWSLVSGGPFTTESRGHGLF